jgi:hypothetical protein
VISLQDHAYIELSENAVIRSKRFGAQESSGVIIVSSEIISDEFSINCDVLSIASNDASKATGHFEIEHVTNLSIRESFVENITIKDVTNLLVSDNTRVRELNILAGSNIDISKESIIKDSKIGAISKMTIASKSRAINVTMAGDKFAKVQFNDAKEITEFILAETDTLRIVDTSKVVGYLEIRNCASVTNLTASAPKVTILDSDIYGNDLELATLTASQELLAVNSSFSAPLVFKDNLEVSLINVSQRDIRVTGSAEVKIYWWLTIYAYDNASNPLSNVVITVYDFLEDTKIASSITDENGMTLFPLIGNSILVTGTKESMNRSYYFGGKYGDYEVTYDTMIRMDGNRVRKLVFTEVEPPMPEPAPTPAQKPPIYLYVGIALAFLIIIVLIGLGIRARRGPPRPKSGFGRSTYGLNPRNR